MSTTTAPVVVPPATTTSTGSALPFVRWFKNRTVPPVLPIPTT